MITEIDDALRRLLSTQTYTDEQVMVDLDPPTRDWSARRSGPVLNLFLNDIREDTTKRSANMIDVRSDDGFVVARRPSERTFMFSYALSAWTSRPEDDHALLSAALMALLRIEYFAEDQCTGTLAVLAAAGRPATVRVGGILFSERLVTELWSAIGGEYRPILAITVSVAIPAGMPTPAGPRQSEPPVFIFEDTVNGGIDTIKGPDPTEPPDESGAPLRTRQRYRLDSSTTKEKKAGTAAPAQKAPRKRTT